MKEQAAGLALFCDLWQIVVRKAWTAQILYGILRGAMVYYFYYELLRLYAEEYFEKI